MKNELLKNIKKLSIQLRNFTLSSEPIIVEKAEYKFYIDYLQEGMTVFDVGANIGELSLLFSKFVGERGQVHAFEASRATFEKLKTIFEANSRARVILNHRAVSDKEGIVKLYVYDDTHSGWNSLADRPLSNYGIYDISAICQEEISSLTIDRYCKEHAIDTIDLLKIDVEGAEYQVLLGCHQMLSEKKIKCCVFEFGQTTFDMGNNPQQIERYLKEIGYRLRNIVGSDPIFPGKENVDKARFSIHVATPR
ncbi:MAG: hypothetical protein N5P05_003591 [Chroococcopsis gigantea SAG 12.99]|jgi:FkbM family methyltransferase|nr:hypothetical protein [Chroococcopsis gigantea SAG 12.99]